IAVEVLTHVLDKRAALGNVAAHLALGGTFLIADVVACTAAEVNMPAIGQFTSTERQVAEMLAERHLKLVRCIDVSQPMANFLDDPDFEENLAKLRAMFPELRDTEAVHRGWQNFGRALRMGLFKYLLLSARKIDASSAAAGLTDE